MREWEPTERVLLANVATPLESVPVPSVVAPSMKVTVPVAVEGATVAVNVTEAPKVEGFKEDVSVVLVVLLTICVTVFEELVP